MLDRDTFEQRAAIMEFIGGMARFEAETAAAREQGATRWEAMRHENDARHFGPTQNHRSANNRRPADNLSEMQRGAKKETRPVLGGHVHQ